MLYCKERDNNYICIPILIGRVAEWLGRGLQNLLQRFESALDLNKKASANTDAFFDLRQFVFRSQNIHRY